MGQLYLVRYTIWAIEKPRWVKILKFSFQLCASVMYSLRKVAEKCYANQSSRKSRKVGYACPTLKHSESNSGKYFLKLREVLVKNISYSIRFHASSKWLIASRQKSEAWGKSSENKLIFVHKNYNFLSVFSRKIAWINEQLRNNEIAKKITNLKARWKTSINSEDLNVKQTWN